MNTKLQQLALTAMLWLTFSTVAGIAQVDAPQRLSPLPSLALLPWEFIGINASIQGAMRRAITQPKQTLLRNLIDNSQSLSNYAASSTPPIFLTLNLKRRADEIMVGTRSDLASEPMAITPVLCSVADHYVVFIAIRHLSENILTSVAHSAIRKSTVDLPQGRGFNHDLIIKTAETTATKAWQVLRERTPEQPTALKIGLGLGFENTRLDQSSSLCLNLLLAEKLVGDFRIVAPLGNESMASMARILQFDRPMQRATRQLTNYWTFPVPSNQPPALPLSVQMKSTFSEAVFGSSIPTSHSHTYTLGPIQNGEIHLEVAPELSAFLNQEANALASTALPKIIKIDRAWAYLDKGRAWGLKIDDRLILEAGGKVIKGHVVGHFGPEQGLTSPDGYPIHEGAIVFIRKGQKDIRVGQSLGFDPQKYPTPWPPAAPKARAK